MATQLVPSDSLAASLAAVTINPDKHLPHTRCRGKCLHVQQLIQSQDRTPTTKAEAVMVMSVISVSGSSQLTDKPLPELLGTFISLTQCEDPPKVRHQLWQQVR